MLNLSTVTMLKMTALQIVPPGPTPILSIDDDPLY